MTTLTSSISSIKPSNIADFSGYLPQSGRTESSRLQILNSLFNPNSLQFIRENVPETTKKTLLNVGCGLGILDEQLACHFQSITGIDTNKQQIEMCKERMAKYGNCTYRVENIYTVGSSGEQYDVVYCRLCLSHLEEPEKALMNLVSGCKEGGIIICEELEGNTNLYCNPSNKGYEFWTKACKAQEILQNSDFEIGMLLPSLLSKANCEVIRANRFQPLLVTEEQKSILRLGLEACKNSFLRFDFKEQDIEEAKSQLELLEKDEKAICSFSPTVQVAAKKKAQVAIEDGWKKV